MRYKPKRAYAWSSAIAYSVGLMASDGCLQSDGRHLDLTSKDLVQLENFSKALNRNFYVGVKLNRNRQEAYRIQFSDVSYYDFLLQVGLTPAKSLTMGRLQVPLEYYAHFLRGVFDGDDTTHGYFDPRWRSSFMYYVSYAGASMSFLEYLRDTNQQLFELEGRSITRATRAFRLQYAKADSYKLYKAMYKDAQGLFLPRKKIKLEGFIKQDKNDTIFQL